MLSSEDGSEAYVTRRRSEPRETVSRGTANVLADQTPERQEKLRLAYVLNQQLDARALTDRDRVGARHARPEVRGTPKLPPCGRLRCILAGLLHSIRSAGV
jgi:hypothetical protein